MMVVIDTGCDRSSINSKIRKARRTDRDPFRSSASAARALAFTVPGTSVTIECVSECCTVGFSTAVFGFNMKITDLEVVELRVPGWTGATFDGSYDNCLVLVHTDAGVTGIAEVDSVPSVIRAIVDAPRSHSHAMGLKAAILLQDAPEMAALWDRMYDLTSY